MSECVLYVFKHSSLKARLFYIFSRLGTCDRFHAENIYQFEYPGIGANIMYMILEGVALLFLLVLIEVCMCLI